MVTVGTRIDGNQGVIEDSEELVAALDTKVKNAIRLGWRPVGDVVTGPDEPGDGQIAPIKRQVFVPF